MPVPLPDGRKLVLTIPAETQNGRLFRLSGKGMPRLRGEGNGTLFAPQSGITYEFDERKETFV